MKKYLLLLLSLIIFVSCKEKNKYPYAIKDFRKELQPHLTRMVSAVYVMGYDSAFEKMVTNEELKQLAISEHPL